jgi:hypothetical protein
MDPFFPLLLIMQQRTRIKKRLLLRKQGTQLFCVVSEEEEEAERSKQVPFSFLAHFLSCPSLQTDKEADTGNGIH